MRKFAAMFKARTMEFVRDRGTFFWNLLFPIVLVFGFAFAFSGSNETMFKVGVIGSPGQNADAVPFLDIDEIEFVRYDASQSGQSREAVIERLRQHELDMVLDLENDEYYVNTESSSGPVLRRLLRASATPGAAAGATAEAGGGDGTEGSALAMGDTRFTERQVSGEPIRLVDWLVPGVIGMNMMFSCLFGVGFVIVRYRKNGVLKRLKATPVSAMNFVSAQAASRLVIAVATSVFVYVGTNAFLGFMMKGSYLDLFLVTVLAIICMISIGLVFASRLKSEELATGLMNLVTFPMIILSGVFFSLEGAPAILRGISKALPLTHFVEGARGIMLEGATFLEIAPHLLYLGGLTVALLFVASLMFRWE